MFEFWSVHQQFDQENWSYQKVSSLTGAQALWVGADVKSEPLKFGVWIGLYRIESFTLKILSIRRV